MNRFKKKFKDRDGLDDAKDDPAAAESPDPGTDDGKASVTSKFTTFL